MTAGSHWTDEDRAILRDGYAQGLAVATIAASLGRSRGSVRNQAYKLGITTRDDAWSDSEVECLRAAYAGNKRKGELCLDRLAEEMGRSKIAICVKARHLGLTNNARAGVPKPKVDRRKYKTREERSAALSERMRNQHATKGHPFAGRAHTPEARAVIAKKSQAWAARETYEERSARITKQMQTRVRRFGSLAPPREKASWKAGWREIGGKRNYYRSRWEANYARYLEWLKQNGQIRDWQHEPETFWFEAIKRGVRSYLPDFRVWENDGATPLHEVKGWMDARSKTTLKRMAKYHPHEQIVVIREKQYNEIARKVGPLIEGWESGGRADRP